MSKILSLFKLSFIFIFLFLLVGCELLNPSGDKPQGEEPKEEEKEVPVSVSIRCKEEILVGEETQLEIEIEPSISNVSFKFIITDTNIVSISGTTVTGLEAGYATIICLVEGKNAYASVDITVKNDETTIPDPVEEEVTISLDCKKEIYIGERTELITETNIQSEDFKFTYVVTNPSVISLNDNIIEGLSAGTTTIICLIEGRSGYAFIEVTVKAKEEDTNEEDPLKDLVVITIECEDELYIGDEMDVTITVTPASDNYQLKIEITDEEIISFEQGRTSTTGKIRGLAEGESTIIVQVEGKEGFKMKDIKVVKDRVAPEFVFTDNVTKDMNVSYNKTFDPLFGVKAIDNHDGDITGSITVEGELDNRKLGTYKFKYIVRDNARNRAVLERVIKVVWDYPVIFIGHAGCYSGIMNSAEAFRNAYQIHHYQAIECDVKQTKDGVFVTCHDDTFNGKTISQYNWSEIKDDKYTTTRGGISYTTTLCTLEEYLKICKAGHCKAIVELKSSAGITNSDQSRMQALMDLIEDCDMLNDVIFLGSQYNCLIWTRTHGYDYIPCQYLVNSCEDETYLNRCINNKLDISFNISYSNSQEWIDRYHEAGCLVSCWTFSQYTTASDLQSWIDKGVDFVTVDVTKPYEVRLPEKEDPNLPTYTVTFKDYDGTVIKQTEVKQGKKATTPVDPHRDGYRFTGWNPSDLTNITSDLEVTATYEVETYTISYVANTAEVTESTWATKADFVNDFYSDLFTWITENYEKMKVLDNSGKVIKEIRHYSNIYELTAKDANSNTITFSNPDELKAVYVYAFESDISSWLYKPIEGSNSADYIPLEDNNYFLNTEPYRTKYQGMNAYLLNCMDVSYTSYSRTYNQASNNRVQIFFRFHQWCNGTNIAAFDKWPKKYIKGDGANITVTMPTEPNTYTILDEVALPTLEATGATFKGWFLEPACTNKVEKIEKGTFGNIVLYAGWE